MSKRIVKIDKNDYIGMLEDRRQQVEPRGWTIPNAVWDYAMETIEEYGVDPENSSPSYIVDNLAVNGDYGEVSNYNGLLDAISDTEQGNALFLYETQDGGSVISPEDAQARYDDAKDEWLESAQLDEDADEDEEFEKTDECKSLCGEIGVCYSLQPRRTDSPSSGEKGRSSTMANEISIGTEFMSRGYHPKKYTVADIYKTYNAAGDLIKIMYVATHDFAGQTLTEHDIPAATIIRGLITD